MLSSVAGFCGSAIATVTDLSFLDTDTGTTLNAWAMVSLTISAISLGMVISSSLTTFIPSCSPRAFITWSSFTTPRRVATLPNSSPSLRFISSRIFHMPSSLR